MAKKISDLNDGTPAQSDDELEIERVTPNSSARVRVDDVRGNLQQTTDLGNETTNPIKFTNTVNPAYAEALLFYDNDKKALSYYNDEEDITINIAQEVVIRVLNNSGAEIFDGKACRTEGSASGLPTIVLAQANTVNNAIVTGVATHDIPDGETGYITRLGNVGGQDTSSFSAGDVLFLSATTAGELVNIPPSIVTAVGIVIVDDPIEGMIIVGPQDVQDPVALAQARTDSPIHTQALTTSPVPLEGYNNTPFSRNMTVTNTAVVGSFRASFAPENITLSGFYQFAGNLTLSNISANVVVFLELYINGSASGIFTRIDASQASITSGSTAVSALAEQIITDSDVIELYVYIDVGTANVDVENVVFNADRLGIS